MKSNRSRMRKMSVVLLALSMSGCQVPVVIQEGHLRDWFLSRSAWSALASLILGVVAAKLLCRLPIKAPLMDCIATARHRFRVSLLALVLIITPLFLWFDAWFTQPFGEGNELGGWAIVSVVILNWRTISLMALVVLTFYVTVAVFTRYLFGRTCNCKHAFIPKFR